MMKNQNNPKFAADRFVLQFRISPIIERRHILDVSLPLLIEKSVSPEMKRYFVNLREFLEDEYRRVIILMRRYGAKIVSGVKRRVYAAAELSKRQGAKRRSGRAGKVDIRQ